FEDLTADRLGSLGASTLATGVRVNLPSTTVLTTTWEHQWRSNATRLDRVTLAIVQSFRYQKSDPARLPLLVTRATTNRPGAAVKTSMRDLHYAFRLIRRQPAFAAL